MFCLCFCLQVQITLADSDQFTFRNCDGCQYSVCLCGEESRTFSWIVTPTALGIDRQLIRNNTGSIPFDLGINDFLHFIANLVSQSVLFSSDMRQFTYTVRLHIYCMFLWLSVERSLTGQVKMNIRLSGLSKLLGGRVGTVFFCTKTE